MLNESYYLSINIIKTYSYAYIKYYSTFSLLKEPSIKQYQQHLHCCESTPSVIFWVHRLLDNDDDVAPDVAVLEPVDELGLGPEAAVGPHLGRDTPHHGQHLHDVGSLDEPEFH